jgi:hypothetical protein
MRTCILLIALAVVPSFAAAAEPAPQTWSLPKADGEKWVRRLQALAREGWKATLQGNDLILAREKSVQFVRILPNAPAAAPDEPNNDQLEEGIYRFVLRFGPRMSLDEYERLDAVNKASTKERERLKAAVNLPHKFDDFITKNKEEEQRVRDYRAAVAKLPYHDLPDFYTDDYSIRLILPGDTWIAVQDKNVSAECADMADTLERAFGIYSPAAAAHRESIGRHER